MAYYLENYSPKRCQSCKAKPAVYELKTSGTQSYGFFCKRCGEREEKTRNANDMAREFNRAKLAVRDIIEQERKNEFVSNDVLDLRLD